MKQSKRILFSCGCGNSTGQLAIETVRQLAINGFGELGSLIALCCHITPPETQVICPGDTLILVEGCNAGCGKKIIEAAGFKINHSLVLTDLGIEITQSLNYLPEDLELAQDGTQAACAEYSTLSPATGCMCG